MLTVVHVGDDVAPVVDEPVVVVVAAEYKNYSNNRRRKNKTKTKVIRSKSILVVYGWSM